MDIDEVLTEISNENSNYEKGNYNSLLSVINTYELDYNFKSVVDIIDENYSLITDNDKRLVLLNKKIQALLRLEDFNETLNTLIIKSAIPSLEKKEKANILFYEAISYEGLNEIYKAICSLEKIEDDLPRTALINKYLKLALLYIKMENFNSAKEAYDYAVKLDVTKKNEMMLLVESDLYYASGNYNQALDSFQTFFLHSEQKYKYLDRYIYILIKLNRLDDAYNFFHEYKNKTNVRLSKTIKYHFFKAGAVLLKRLEKYDELYEVNSFLEEEKPTYFKKNENERDLVINSITKSLSYPLTIYDKYKNIANKFFKLLNDIPKDELIFIEKTNDSFNYSKFNNTELKPTILLNSDLKENDLFEFFDIKDDVILDYFYNNKLSRIESKVKAYVIKDEYHFYGYFLASYSAEFDNLYNILRDALLFEFIRLDEMTKGKKTEIDILKTIENSMQGYIKIKEDYVELFDGYSKRLFDCKSDVMPFSVFKDMFKDDIYVDSFLNVGFKEAELKNGRMIEFNITIIDNCINAVVKDTTLIKSISDERKEYYYYGSLDFGTLNALKDRINEKEESFSILGLYIPIIEDDDLINERDHKLKLVYNFLERFSPSSTLYYLGENHFLYAIESVDKRILEGIFNNVKNNIRNLYRYSASLRENKTFGFASKNLKNKTFDEITDLIEYGFFSASLNNDYLILDNLEKRNYQIFKMFENEVKRYIERKELEEIYYPIVNVSTKQIHFFLEDFLYPYDLSHETLEKIFRKEELTIKRDEYSLDVVVSNLKNYNKNIRYIVRIHKGSLFSPSFTDKLLSIDKEYINNIYLYIDIKDLTIYKDIIIKIKEYGYNLAINIDNLSINSDYSMFKMVFSSLDTKNIINYNFIKSLIDNKINVCMTNKTVVDGCLNLDSSIKPYSVEELKRL